MLRQRCIMLVIIVIVSTMSSGLFWTQSTNTVYAQSEKTVKCGEIIESEFTRDYEDHTFVLTMQPRESFSVSLEPTGDYLLTAIAIQGPTGIRLGLTHQTKTPTLESGTLSGRGTYKILVRNVSFVGGEGTLGGVGIYTLYIGCVKSDGTIIKPGDVPQPTPIAAPSPARQTGSQASPAPESVSAGLLSFLEVGQSYEVVFATQTRIIKLIELSGNGWAKIEMDNRTGWLNLSQVALIIPVD